MHSKLPKIAKRAAKYKREIHDRDSHKTNPIAIAATQFAGR
jgi:hypothetical protein